jgi:hypothetical protein
MRHRNKEFCGAPSTCATEISILWRTSTCATEIRNYSSAGFGPLNYSLWASSASALFERGLRSLELFSSGQQHLRIIRVRASVPRIVFFGLAAPLRYSSAGPLVPRIALSGFQRLGIIRVRALFSLESFFLGQQRLHILRVRASVPRIIFFGPAAPPYSSSAGFDPSNRSLWASSTSIFFECGLWSLELLLSGQQRLGIIRVRAPVPRIAPSGQQCLGIIRVWAFLSLESLLQVSSTSTLFDRGLWSLELFSSG